MSAEAFLAAARGFLGVPWVHQGRTDRGVDCVGLVIMAARAAGIPDAPMEATYGRMQDYRQARRYLEQFCDRVGHALPGDIVLFKTSQTLHMAVISEVDDDSRPRRVLQAYGPKSKVVETGLQFPPLMLWRPRWPS